MIRFMNLKAIIIVSLLVIVIAAPVVDAIACDDCKDIIPLQDLQQRLTNGVDHSDGQLLSSADARTAQQETGTAQDLCPVCSDTAAAMDNARSDVPSMIILTNHLPKLIALSGPSYSITKPPQN